jgi:uroporphyrinogen-III synthase
VAAIGPATAAALTTRGVQPAFVPPEFIGESLAQGLGPLQGKRILLPRAEGARQALPAGLVEQGASVDEIGIYRAATPPGAPAGLRQLAQGVEAVTFTSPSTVEGFIQLARQAGLDPQNLPGTPCLACIGPITAAAARREGLRPDIVASRYTADGLVEALISHFQQEVPACSS